MSLVLALNPPPLLPLSRLRLSPPLVAVTAAERFPLTGRLLRVTVAVSDEAPI